MSTMRIQGNGGWIDYDGEHVEIVRSGVWHTLTGMKGTHSLQLSEIAGIRFRRAKRGHGPGFVQFLRVDDPIGEAQQKMLGVYGRKDDIASAQLDDYALTFSFRQHADFVSLKEAIEHDLGQQPAPIEEPTVTLQSDVWRRGQSTPPDFAALDSESADAAPAATITRRAGLLRPKRYPTSPKPADNAAEQLAETEQLATDEPTQLPKIPKIAVSVPKPHRVSDSVTITDTIAKLAELYDQGILGEAEFVAKKAELLARI
ncbi:MAG: SHOCT domain-containing protein [Propionibacteriaceae bacterium]|jgi:hypothetical protein|nr:SHOCT domain-containing protein [Propionibacteriaceae bacterium]